MQETLARICGEYSADLVFTPFEDFGKKIRYGHLLSRTGGLAPVAQQFDDLERYLDSVQTQQDVTRTISDAHLFARDELNQELALSDVQIAALKRENDLLKAKDAESQQKVQALQALNDGITKELGQMQETAHILQDEVDDAVEKAQRKKVKIQGLRDRVDLLQTTVVELEDALEEAQDNGEDLQAEDEAFLSNDEDYEEEMQIRAEEYDYEMGTSEDEDDPIEEDEEDPEEVLFETDVGSQSESDE
jgi:chromosome segregation ATPase